MNQITLNIGGEDRVFYFGLGFLGNLLENEGIQLQEVETKLVENGYKWMPLIMWHSLSYGYIRKNEKMPFSVYDISEWIDELTEFDEKEVEVNGQKVKVQLQTVVSKFFEAFWNSVNKNVPEDKSKKKATQK